jgi:hypothetical protein
LDPINEDDEVPNQDIDLDNNSDVEMLDENNEGGSDSDDMDDLQKQRELERRL